jgi:anti-anti-sigma factor
MTPPLSYRIERRLPIALVRLVGELDGRTRESLRRGLTEALVAEPTSAIVDLAGLSVTDPEQVTVFSEAAADAARWPGAPLLLCHAAPAVAETLRRHGVDRHCSVHPTVTAALREAAAQPVPPRLHRRLAPTQYAPRVARELAAGACARWELPHLTTAAQMVCSELVTNAVRHAGTMIDLTITLRDDALRVSVRDGFVRPARLRTPGATDDSGRGLLIVDTVASAWGNVPIPDGKLVWASLALARRTDGATLVVSGV